MNKRVRDLINESGAGLWGTDKARERLQKDTPGQEIKSLVKKSQKVSEAADPKGTIKVVKQDKVRYITKDELNTYRQMGWKQVEKRPQADAKRAGVGSDRETFRDRQKRLGKPQTESVEQLDELKISFKFDKLADAAKAERKANQMKKLNVDSEKVQGKMMWLLHVTGNYTDIMKYIKRVDLEDKVHESAGIDEGMLDTLKQRVQQAQDALKKFRDSETAKKVRDDHRARVEKGKKVLDAPNLRKKINKESIEEGSETWEAGYKRRVVKTTKPEHKEKGYNWRIKGKDKAHLTIKLYKEKPSQAEFNKQMKRVAGHEFGG